MSIKQRLDSHWIPRRDYSQRGNLELRRARVVQMRERILAELPFEHVRTCACGLRSGEACQQIIIAMRDRYGFPIRLALCHETGLVFLVDRLTRSGYQEFYERGLYRELVGLFHNNPEQNVTGDLHTQARSNARSVITALHGSLCLPEGATLLEVGGGTGALALAFRDEYHVNATVLDPAGQELEMAASFGLNTKVGLIEEANFSPGERYDVIILNQMVEHLVDIREAFEKVLTLLNSEGYLIFDVLDFIAETERVGCAEAASRLDHCHFLYDEMVDTFCTRMGLSIEKRIRHTGFSILYLCRKAEPDPDATFSEERRFRLTRSLLTQDLVWKKSPLILRRPIDERIAGRVRNLFRA